MKKIRSAKKILLLVLVVCMLFGLSYAASATDTATTGVSLDTSFDVQYWHDSEDLVSLESGTVTEITDTQVTVALEFSYPVMIKNKQKIVIANNWPNGPCDHDSGKYWQLYGAAELMAAKADTEGYSDLWFAVFNRCPEANTSNHMHDEPWGEAPYSVPDGTFIWLTDQGVAGASCHELCDSTIDSSVVIGKDNKLLSANKHRDTQTDDNDEALVTLTDGRATEAWTTYSANVTLDETKSVNNLYVMAGATLDLNGHTLTVLGDMISFGQVTDTAEAKGGIVIEKNQPGENHLVLQSGNQAMPLYDTDFGGYRLFSYTIKHAMKPDPDAYEVKFGVHLKFDSLKGYELLADAENADITMTMDLTLNHQKTIPVGIPSSILTTYAEAMQADATRNYVIVLRVYGFENVTNFVSLAAKPKFVSGTGVEAIGDVKTYYNNSAAAADARAWLEAQIEEDTLFSLFCTDLNIDTLSRWKKTIETPSDTEWTLRYETDQEANESGKFIVWADITLDEEMAALSWTVHIKKESSGTHPNPSFINIKPLNSSLDISDAQLITAYGSKAAITDFQPIFIDLAEKGSFSLPEGANHPDNPKEPDGRSSDVAFPYFEISNGTKGVMGAIGWTGNWQADFTYANGTVDLSAGFKDDTIITLNDGEEIRTPSITLQFFNGDSDTGHNNFRDLMLKSYTPKDENGQIVEVPNFISLNGEDNEDEIIEALEQAKTAGLDVEGLWIDASWFGNIDTSTDWLSGDWENEVGNWYFNDTRFPNGLSEVSNYLKENDMELLLWFEPERAKNGSWITEQCSDDFFISIEGSNDLLFDFSNDDACEFMITFISNFIQENNITWYRHDFNISPNAYWTAQDEKMSRDPGMTEIMYITNLYRFFDELVERNPGLFIDNCASGGRRLDIEMMKRSVPLWRTDCIDHPNDPAHSIVDGKRSINFNLTWWLPIHAGGYPWYGDGDPDGDGQGGQYNDKAYNMRSVMGAVHPVSGGLINSAEWLVPILDQYEDYQEYMLGDYYMLSYGIHDDIGYSSNCGYADDWEQNMDEKNAAYQFYAPEKDAGYVMTFCPLEGTTLTDTYCLRGLNPNSEYDVTNADTGDTWTRTGEELMTDGISVSYQNAGTSYLIYYTAK